MNKWKALHKELDDALENMTNEDWKAWKLKRNKMEKEFVPYELALRMKQIGFNENKFAYYYLHKNKPLLETQGSYDFGTHSNSVSAPLYQQAFRWFREKYPDLDFGVAKIHNGNNNYHYHINLKWEFFEGSYEEAELACLEKLIEIVERNNIK